MRLVIIWISVFVLLSSLAIAETQIFSGKVITDTEKIIDGRPFKFIYDVDSNRVFVQSPVSGVIVANGECKSNDVYKICINSANFSYKNITTYVYYYEVGTTIYALTASLSTASKITPSTLLLGESADITITITNPTDFDVSNIAYKEDLTPFYIKELNGCNLDGKQISWSGSLKSRYDKTCTLKVVAQEQGTYNLIGNLKYFNYYQTKEDSTNQLSFTILPKQLSIIQSIDNNVEVKQPFFLNTSLQNINNDEAIDVRATIEMPRNIKIIKSPQELNKEFNILKRNFVLEHGSVFNYSLYLEATTESQDPVKQTFVYTIKGITGTIENFTYVNPAEPKPIINISTLYEKLIPSEKIVVIAKLTNPSKVHELTNIKATLTIPNSNSVIQTSYKLMPNESYIILSQTVILPDTGDINFIDGKGVLKLNLTIAYNFYEVVRYLNKSIELKLSTIGNETENLTSSVSNQSQNNFTNATIKDTLIKKNVSSDVFVINKADKFDIWTMIIVAISVLGLLPVFFIVYKIRKMRKLKKNQSELEKELNEEESFNENKENKF